MNLGVTWNTVLQIAAGLIVLFQCGKWFINLGNPFTELRKRVDKHDSFLANDKSHLEQVDRSIQQIDEGISVLGFALAQIMSHEINGNDIQKLREQKEKVETYFYGRQKNE